jgi:hypothetical protein
MQERFTVAAILPGWMVPRFRQAVTSYKLHTPMVSHGESHRLVAVLA